MTIPKPIRDKYAIVEGDTLLYIDLGDHVAVLKVPADPLKILAGISVDEKATTAQIRKKALETAQKLVEKKFQRR
ncbi:MAG: hypothetical protein ACTSW4_05300 [Candidatus Ranarchaeia archaeon]